MSRGWWACALLGLVGCQQTITSNTAHLVGSHDVALQGSFLVITSADTNELRVLDTGTRRFLTAPNPLETLTVPVLDRPTTLVQDEAWAGGKVGPGAYVIALRPGAAEASVVWVDPADAGTGLYEVKRVPFAAPITAAAAVRAPGGDVTLFAATFDGAQGQLTQLALPGEPRALAAAATSQLARGARTVASFAGAAAVDAAIVPPLSGRTLNGTPFCDQQVCVALALRESAGRAGDVRLVDPASGRSAEVEFPGPVRHLATHAVGAGLEAGEHLFGLLDEAACGSSACGGVAVAVLRKAPAGVFPGLGAPPLRTGGGLAMGMSVTVGAPPNGAADVEAVELVGVLTSGDGTLHFFDGATGTPFETTTGEGDSAVRNPYVVILDSGTANGCSGAILPGESSWDTTTPSAPKLFVAYPSANAVGELQPANTGFVNGAAGSAQLALCHR